MSFSSVFCKKRPLNVFLSWALTPLFVYFLLFDAFAHAEEISFSNLGMEERNIPSITQSSTQSSTQSNTQSGTKSDASVDNQNETKIDWSKPVVSRGFGLERSSSSFLDNSPGSSADDSTRSNHADKINDLAKLKQYQSGQVFYFFGEYEKAVEKWLPLLDQDFPEAQASMGWLYQAGLGVQKDENKAFALYTKAANQNNAIAQNNLGVMYENGITVDPNTKNAEHWYKLSAEQGYRFGQYNYANILLLEQSLKKMNSKEKMSDSSQAGEAKLVQAISYLKKSAHQGVKQANDMLQSLNIKSLDTGSINSSSNPKKVKKINSLTVQSLE